MRRVCRWPQDARRYTVAHPDPVAHITGWTGQQTGLAVAGGSCTGVGVPNCIASGEAVVVKSPADCQVDLES